MNECCICGKPTNRMIGVDLLEDDSTWIDVPICGNHAYSNEYYRQDTERLAAMIVLARIENSAPNDDAGESPF